MRPKITRLSDFGAFFFWKNQKKCVIFVKKSRFFSKKAIDKRKKKMYNLNEPNGSQRFGGVK